MRPTSQLKVLKDDLARWAIHPLSIRHVFERLEDLRSCGVHFLKDTVRAPYDGFVKRGFGDECHPFLLFSDWSFGAYEVMVQKAYADPGRFFDLGRKWDEGFDAGNPLLGYLEGRIDEAEMDRLTAPLAGDEKTREVNVGNQMIHVSSKDGKLVYDAELEAHRIVKPKLFGGFQVTDFLLPSVNYVTKRPELDPRPPYVGEVALAPDGWLS